jgi:hypothetical protein
MSLSGMHVLDMLLCVSNHLNQEMTPHCGTRLVVT